MRLLWRARILVRILFTGDRCGHSSGGRLCKLQYMDHSLTSENLESLQYLRLSFRVLPAKGVKHFGSGLAIRQYLRESIWAVVLNPPVLAGEWFGCVLWFWWSSSGLLVVSRLLVVAVGPTNRGSHGRRGAFADTLGFSFDCFLHAMRTRQPPLSAQQLTSVLGLSDVSTASGLQAKELLACRVASKVASRYAGRVPQRTIWRHAPGALPACRFCRNPFLRNPMLWGSSPRIQRSDACNSMGNSLNPKLQATPGLDESSTTCSILNNNKHPSSHTVHGPTSPKRGRRHMLKAQPRLLHLNPRP